MPFQKMERSLKNEELGEGFEEKVKNLNSSLKGMTLTVRREMYCCE